MAHKKTMTARREAGVPKPPTATQVAKKLVKEFGANPLTSKQTKTFVKKLTAMKTTPYKKATKKAATQYKKLKKR